MTGTGTGSGPGKGLGTSPGLETFSVNHNDDNCKKVKGSGEIPQVDISLFVIDGIYAPSYYVTDVKFTPRLFFTMTI